MFYQNTKATFRGCQVPKRQPDYISDSGSKYWYGENKNGKYLIRLSNHWIIRTEIYDCKKSNKSKRECKTIATCQWKLKTNTISRYQAGKCYLKDFVSI